MASLAFYEPRPLTLPEDGELSRGWNTHRSNWAWRPLTDEDLASYERHTVFHDVFLDHRREHVVAVGPAAVNLARAISPALCRARRPGGPHSDLRERVDEYESIRVTRWQLPPTLRGAAAIDVELSLPCGLRWEGTCVGDEHGTATQSLTTLQRDNDPRWIGEWLQYYEALGVDRLVLYDNGSANYDELVAYLRELRCQVAIVIASWQFPYGPYHSYGNCFAQRSQLNHAHHRYGGSSWMLNFDVDEYLFVPQGLPELLATTSRRWSVVRFHSHVVPTAVDDPADLPPHSIRCFPYRTIARKQGGMKYAWRPAGVRYAGVHSARSRLGFLGRVAPPDRAFFYHYDGITTNYKKANFDYELRRAFDPAVHVRDESLLTALDNLGVPEPPR